MLNDHECHMIWVSYIDAEIEAFDKGMQMYVDYTPIAWRRNPTTKVVSLERVILYTA